MWTLAQVAAESSRSWWERNAPLVALIGVVVGALLGAIVGAFLGYLLRAREWRRERRHETYAAYFHAVLSFMDTMNGVVAAIRNARSGDVLRQRGDLMERARTEFDRTYAEVTLIGTDEAIKAADVLHSLHHTILNELTDSTDMRATELTLSEKYQTRLDAAIDGFTKAARKDIIPR